LAIAALIDGLLVNGSWKLVGMVVELDSQVAVWLSLPLCLGDDLGYLFADDVLRLAQQIRRVEEMGMLSLAIWTPIAFGVVLLALGRDEQAPSVRWLSLVGAVVEFLGDLAACTAASNLSTAAMQFVEKASWIERFNVNYHLGVDGISLWFVHARRRSSTSSW
jgi:hypothetical protein